jgi:hypothetical protein
VEEGSLNLRVCELGKRGLVKAEVAQSAWPGGEGSSLLPKIWTGGEDLCALPLLHSAGFCTEDRSAKSEEAPLPPVPSPGFHLQQPLRKAQAHGLRLRVRPTPRLSRHLRAPSIRLSGRCG